MIDSVLQTKFLKSFDSPIEYIEKIPGLKVDIDLLFQEFKIIEKLEWMIGTVQSKLCVHQNCQWKECTNEMHYTKSVIDGLKDYIPFNSVYYRYVHSNTCYNWHVDKMKTCLHIPLITNEGCKFVYDDAVFSMPADGSVYIVNNSKPHTFMNAGPVSRLHITMDIF